MSIKRMFFGVPICGAIFFACNANAQNVPSPNNIDSRFAIEWSKIDPQAIKDDEIQTGKGDILLLRRTKLISFMAGASRTSTDNAFLSPEDKSRDNQSTFNMGLRLGTTIAEKFDVFADISAVQSKYVKNKDLDFSAISSNIGVNTAWRNVEIGLKVSQNSVFDEKFDERQLKQTQYSIELSRPIVWRNISFIPTIMASKTIANPSDYDMKSYGIELTASTRLSKTLPLTAYLTIGYNERDYDSYFYDILGVYRYDRLSSANVGIQYQLSKSLLLGFHFGYQNNNSTSDVNGFNATSGTLGLSIQSKF